VTNLEAAGEARCPELEALEQRPLAAATGDHVARCEACRLVVEVFEHGAALDDCLRFDALLAARADGSLNSAGHNLLDRHLASCASCRAVAQTLSPTQDAHGDHASLPKVDPADYAVGLEVARGGMGRILAARDLRVGRPVALKELLGRSPHLAARFEREARVTARLQHPGIVPIYEIGRWPDGTPFYTMRMVDGGTLRAAIDQLATRSAGHDRTTRLAARLALLPAVIAASEAIAFAHGQRVVHRDITPSNIIVGAYGETVVIDWGLAKDLSPGTTEDDPYTDPYRSGPTASDELTGAGAVVGTLAYMAPEQAHAAEVDERADVYALGAILYHVVAGTPPYRAGSSDELLAAVKAGPPPTIDRVAPTTPRDLVSIITKAMARDPHARYPSARELAEELNRFQTGRMVEAHSYSRVELVRRFVKRNRAAVTVTLLAVIVLGSAGTAAIARIIHSRAEARDTARALILEKGLAELRSGNGRAALAYLHEASQGGPRSSTLDFLLGTALADIAASERTLDCGGQTRFVGFSPDGKAMAVACHDVAKVWTIADGTLVATLPQHAGGFDTLTYSHDGATLATWGEDGIARLWDARSGALRREFRHAPGKNITFTTFTPDDRRIATAGDDGFARIWDVETGAQLREIEAASLGLRRVYGVLSHDGTRMLTTTMLGRGRAWNVDTGEDLGGFEHGSLVSGGEVSPDGTRALSCGLNGLTKLWDTRTGALLHTLEGHHGVVWKCVFSADGSLALTTGHDGTGKIWDLAAGELITSVDHGDIVVAGSFSHDGNRFVTVGVAGGAKVWDTHGGALLSSHDTVRGKDARFTPDGEHLVALRGDYRIQLWGASSTRTTSFRPPADSRVVGVTGEGTGIATEAGRGEVRVWAQRETARDAPWLPLTHPSLDAPIVTSAQRIAGKTLDGVAVVDVRTHATRELAVAEVSGLQLSGDGRCLVVMHPAAPPEIWDVDRGTRLVTLDGATRAIASPDCRRAVAWTGSAGSIPTIWDVELRARSALLPASDARPVGFSLDGTRVAVVEQVTAPSHAVSLWNTETGTAVMTRRDVSVEPSFDPTGRWLTTIGAVDRVVTIWRTRDGTIHDSFPGELLLGAQVSADAGLVAGIGDYGRAVLVMSATDGRILARWPIDQAGPSVTETGFRPPSGLTWWTPDSRSIVSQAAGVAIWSTSNPYTSERVAELVRQNVPWRVVNGQLQLIQNARLAGRVMHGSAPVADARVQLDIRTPPDVGAAPINWESTKAKFSRVEQQTASDGTFAFEQLVFGEYALTVVAAGTPAKTFEVHVGADEHPLELELTDRAGSDRPDWRSP
jgi:WD40 repeat protein